MEIAAKVGIAPFFLDDILIPAGRMSAVALKRSFMHLYQADRSLKSSRIDPEVRCCVSCASWPKKRRRAGRSSPYSPDWLALARSARSPALRATLASWPQEAVPSNLAEGVD
jgi:hypothetical protein